jgi:hypothetical protein
MEDITQYYVVWLYQVAAANDGRFMQGTSQAFDTSAEAIDFYTKLQAYETTGKPYDGELVSHITIVDQVGRDILSTLVAQ